MLINGDCLEHLLKMKDESVDATITDPPFGLGFDYGEAHKDKADHKKHWEWLGPLYRQMLRVTKPGGLIAVWQATKYMRHFWDWFGDDIRIYSSCKNFVQLRKTPINYAYDPIVMFYKKGHEPLRPVKPKRNVDFFVANTARVVSKPELRPNHPCPRPLDAVEQIIDNFSIPGGTVLDPFMGSGTTGVACKTLGRDFIGIEKDEKYFNDARERIKNA